jgi:hypothetical protein
MRGRYTAKELEREYQLLADTLRQDDRAHLQEFLEAWGRA